MGVREEEGMGQQDRRRLVVDEMGGGHGGAAALGFVRERASRRGERRRLEERSDAGYGIGGAGLDRAVDRGERETSLFCVPRRAAETNEASEPLYYCIPTLSPPLIRIADSQDCWFRHFGPAAMASDGIAPRDVCVVGVARTPMGGFLGALSSLPATKLGSLVIQAALKRANVDPALVQEVYFGNVLSANLGQAPARQAALGAGIPNTVVCTTVNKVCASGMKATMFAAQSIQLGINDIVVAGGMESMSNAPKYIAEARKGSRFGHDTLVDAMLKDGLWDVYNDCAMGMCAELCADNHALTREDQDAFAIQSNERGIVARDSGAFAWEIIPVEVPAGRGKPPVLIEKDESLDKFDPVKLKKLRPSFKENGGTVTAGNASSISDGAAALVLVSGQKAQELGLQVLARIKGYADAAQAPELFTTTPALAIPKAIANAGLESSHVDFYEINEAFSAVALANQKLLGIPSEKINVHGGAVSLGHPLGCSGARILVTLLGVLREKGGKIGVAGVCNGGGGASALVLELK